MSEQYNLRSPAVRRLMKEAQELSSPTEHYYAQPLDDNLFEWHFTVRGPADTDYAGGFYHGRIILPAEYPMKPPSIMFLTENGRFETHSKICLSISRHHPETWQPSWSIRTALLAIIGFMPTPGKGAVGALDYPTAEKQKAARRSQKFACDVCGAIKDLLKEVGDHASEQEQDTQEEMKQLAAQLSMAGEKGKGGEVTSPSGDKSTQQGSTPLAESVATDSNDSISEPSSSLQPTMAPSESQGSSPETVIRSRRAQPEPDRLPNTNTITQSVQRPAARVSSRSLVDILSYYSMIFIAVVIGLLVARRLLKMHIFTSGNE